MLTTSDEVPLARTSRPSGTVGPGNAASIVFTSGSSGTPKAILLEHRNLVSFACNPSLPRLTPEDRVAQVSSLSFDTFHFEMWCSIACGAEIVVLPSAPDFLADDLAENAGPRAVTVMLLPTFVLAHAVTESRAALLPLRILCTGGDVVPPAMCRDLREAGFEGQLFNFYGPSETTTACTVHEVHEVPHDVDSIPIGRPIKGVSAYVLGDGHRPVAAGSVGELYIAGEGVARGYLGRPELTADRFPPDPFAADSRRMYRTGDLVRQRADGNLDFLGRIDDQVKIRGHRVEPDEVRRQLCRHPGVRDAAVIVEGEVLGRHLVALVVAEDQLAPKALRRFAEAELPNYMIPNEILTVAEIPADDHGKRDWDELRRILERHRGSRSGHVPPESATERQLAELWEELLGVERVGLEDDFFMLGGHSLLAYRLLRRLEREVGVTVELQTLVDTPVLRPLAALIEVERPSGVADRSGHP